MSQDSGECQEDLDICEAVFRHQLGTIGVWSRNDYRYTRYPELSETDDVCLKSPQEPPALFLSICGEDPSPEFLARFEDKPFSVTTGSEFAIGKGLAYGVNSIKRIHKNRALVDGGYYVDGLGASGNIYTLVRKNDQWAVTKDELQWIS